MCALNVHDKIDRETLLNITSATFLFKRTIGVPPMQSTIESAILGLENGVPSAMKLFLAVIVRGTIDYTIKIIYFRKKIL